MADPRLREEVHPKLSLNITENPFDDPWKMGAWDAYNRDVDNPFDKQEEYTKWKKYDDGVFSANHDLL